MTYNQLLAKIAQIPEELRKEQISSEVDLFDQLWFYVEKKDENGNYVNSDSMYLGKIRKEKS